MWYRWTRMGKITQVHKNMEAYHKVIDGLMDGKYFTIQYLFYFELTT